jgi:ribonuclease-3
MSNEKDLVLKFCRNLNLPFNNLDLIQMALVHPSYSQEKSGVGNNQRLEFLGDAVLNFVVAEYLYNHYKDKAEGDLTKIRARVVCERSLMEVAKSIDLGQYLLLGKGEEMSGGRRRKSILADAVESVIGAIYLDQGYQYDLVSANLAPFYRTGHHFSWSIVSAHGIYRNFHLIPP